MKHISRKILTVFVPVVLGAAIVASFVYACRPYSKESMKRCTSMVETRSVFRLSADGCRNLYFTCTDGRSLCRLSFSRGEAEASFRSTAFWVNDCPFYPSARGKLLAADVHTLLFRTADSINAHLPAVIDSTIKRIDVVAVSLDKKRREFAYYLERHNVSDEGFNSIADLNADNDRRLTELSQIRAELVKMRKCGQASAKAMQTFRACAIAEASDSVVGLVCTCESADGSVMSLRTLTEDAPSGAVSISTPPFGWIRPDSGDVVFLSGYYSVSGEEPSDGPVVASACMNASERHDFPRFGMSDFSPVFTSYGFFAGYSSSDSIVGRACIGNLFR